MARIPPSPSGCAEERSRRWVKGRACPSRRRVCADPSDCEYRRLPRCARRTGDADGRVAFSLLHFFWRSKRNEVARRGETRPATPDQGKTISTKKELQQAQPERPLSSSRNRPHPHNAPLSIQPRHNQLFHVKHRHRSRQGSQLIRRMLPLHPHPHPTLPDRRSRPSGEVHQ